MSLVDASIRGHTIYPDPAGGYIVIDSTGTEVKTAGDTRPATEAEARQLIKTRTVARVDLSRVL